jgi:3-dehydroquinate dehydratase-1
MLSPQSPPAGKSIRQKSNPKFWVAVPVLSPPRNPGAFARSVADQGGNAIELRADALLGCEKMPVERLRAMIRAMKRSRPDLLIILTPRAVREGGMARLDATARKTIVQALLDEVDAVDVELRSVRLRRWAESRVPDAGKLLIVSYHDFECCPTRRELDRLLAAFAHCPKALLKIAAFTQTRHELLRLLTWTRLHAQTRPLAIMSMGPPGRAGRLLLPLLGSRMAFATLGATSAPGQISLPLFVRGLSRLRSRMRSLARAHSDDTLIPALLDAAESSLEKTPG